MDWLRSHGRLGATPVVVYTLLGLDGIDLTRLRTGQSVLFLAERTTKGDVQRRLLELLDKLTT